MTKTTVVRPVVCLALLMCGVSSSSNWDYRFYENTSPRNNIVSSRINNGISSSSGTLYSEGGEVLLQDMGNGVSTQINRNMNISRSNSAPEARHVSMMSERGDSDQVSFEDKNVTNSNMKLIFQSEENGDVSTNSTSPSSDDSRALQILEFVNKSSPQVFQSLYKTDISKQVKSRSSDAQQPSTDLAIVGRSLDEHHTESPGPRSDAVSSYYDFLVNEGSYKFWSVFQVFTAALLIYSAFAAVYYAKYTFATMDYPDYLDDGFFFRRSGADRAQGDDMYYDDEVYDTVTTTSRPQQSTFLGMSSSTFQRIMDALSSKKYS